MEIEIKLTEDEIKEAFRVYCRDRLGISDNFEVTEIYTTIGQVRMKEKVEENE